MSAAVNGTNQQFTLTNTIMSGYPFTVAGWFYTDVSAANQTMFCLGHSGNNTDALILRVENSALLRAVAADSGGVGTATASASISTGAWQHGCAVFASTSSRTVYLNGANSGSNSTSVSPTLNQATFGSFKGLTSEQWFGGGSPGLLAEWGIWQAALSTDDINALAKGFAPPLVRPQSLLAYYPFSRDALVADRWRSALNLTAVNGPTAGNISPRMIYPQSLMCF